VFLSVSVLALVLIAVVPRNWVTHTSSTLQSLAALSLLWSGVQSLFGQPWALHLWRLSGWGQVVIGEGHLSAYFLIVTGLVLLPVALYSPCYLQRLERSYNMRIFAAIFHGLTMAIVLTYLARDVITFLIMWEIMSIASYLAVNFEHLHDSHTRAGYIMLGASEAGFLVALGAWLPLVVVSHSINFAIISGTASQHMSAIVGWTIMLCSFFGFGVKAGLFPSMSWLPRAHPAAPANFSAMLSAIILNLGIYGIVLINGALHPITRPAEGLLVVVIGSLTAIIGILYASTENHLKRMLAHSSIENMGLITIALGSMFAFRAAHMPNAAFIAGIAAFYQILNHSVYKTLLFLGAGAIDVGSGELEMDRLGGLAKKMPWTSGVMLVGAMSISALPPFNGFVSEWLIIQALLRSVEISNSFEQVIFALSGVIVALTAGLAVTAFLKLFGMVFLGRGRSDAADNAREIGVGPKWAMGLLAATCLILGVTPTYVVSALQPLVSSLGGNGDLSGLVPSFFNLQHLSASLAESFQPLGAETGRSFLPSPGLVFLHQSNTPSAHVVFASSPSYLAAFIAITLGIVYLVMRFVKRRRVRTYNRPWQGGVHDVPANANYTATGFSNPIVLVFRAVLRPEQPIEREEMSASNFHKAIRRETRESYVVDRLIFYPSNTAIEAIASLLAKLHHGKINMYMVYAFVTLMVVMILSLWVV